MSTLATNTYEIPLTNVPQTFTIDLAGVSYILTCRWNDQADAGWTIDLADALTETPIVCNIPLVTGCDLLAGYEYLGIGGQLIVYTDGDQYAVPTLDNLGTTSNLYFLTAVASGD